MVRVKVTSRAKTIEYAIRDVITHTEQLVKDGKKIYYLNIGDPAAFDFKTPQNVKDALCRAVEQDDNYYSPSEGRTELREAIAKKEKRVNNVDIAAEDVIVTEGISEGIQMLLAALVQKGDEILFPGPTYPPYISYTRFFDGTPVSYETIEEEDWQPNIDDLRSKISDKTRAIVIINPNNPTGSVYDRKTIQQILDIAGEHDLLVLSDEIYDQLTYEKEFVSTACLSKDVPVVGLNGFSKVYQMTGWRLGYLYFKGEGKQLDELKQAVEKECRIRICANTPVQIAATAALNGPQDFVNGILEKMKQRRDFAWKRLNEIDGISTTKPEGAFYIFPKIHAVGSRWKTDMAFVLELLRETGVLTVNGSGFDPVYGKGHVRIVFLPPIEELDAAFNALEQFMKNKQKGEALKHVGYG
ncbi:aminotransferase class I/II-fold pyridoxal phosphate-dependent enzyme [Candidatus Bathyarchaeota archaeon A05DMB-2]|jgi:tyrosine/nicotianamine family aminotransferase|nr:aminotransferase class I/II-fold pyridoxal phosphate-dependent enzyme [Candidatus Bathyarchaeota archaeon A05DMB-2]